MTKQIFLKEAYSLVEERDKYFKYRIFLLKELYEIKSLVPFNKCFDCSICFITSQDSCAMKAAVGISSFPEVICSNAGKSMLNCVDIQVSFQGKIKAKPSFIFNTIDIMKFLCLIWRNENL